MTRIDFYVLSSASSHGRHLTACRLAEKAYRAGHRVYVQTATAQDEVALDDLLWTFKQNSFVPHARWQGEGEPDVPVLVGHRPAPAFSGDVLIHLNEAIPDAYERFERIAEIVDADAVCRAAGRRR
jgi:DNA polymerase-3 subunit chi